VRDGDPAYSPDGGRISFESFRDGASEVYTMAADGSGVTRLTTNGGPEYRSTVWSPDGTKIAFHSTRDPLSPLDTLIGSPFEIYVMNADGSDQTRITTNGATDTFPAWSPDGSRLAFTSNRDIGDFEIYTMKPDGTDVQRVTSSPLQDGHPSWSPDGKQIAFHSQRDGDFDIYRVNADGSGTTRVTNTSVSETFPVWSPDGKRIAFNGPLDPADSSNNDVYHASAVDGSDLVRATRADGFDGRCDWATIPGPRLTVVKAGSGSGTVTSDPPGIACGAVCTSGYATGTRVTLTFVPDEGSTLVGVDGGGCSGTPATCTVTLSEARTVTATFAAESATAVGGSPTVPATTPAVGGSPTVPATTPAGPVVARPGEASAALRRRPALSVRSTPKRDRRRPFGFTVSGRLAVPAPLTAASACSGGVTVRFKAGSKTIALRRVSVSRTCRFSRRFTFRDARRFGGRPSLRVQARFDGNARLLPARARMISVRVR
jgi:dipeptidyl aminopeptidase/acylaminoacyl peptidase